MLIVLHVQLVAARAEVKEAEKQRKAVRDAQKRAAEAGPVLHTPAPIAPTLISPDGQAPRRTLVVCPLAVVSTDLHPTCLMFMPEKPCATSSLPWPSAEGSCLLATS